MHTIRRARGSTRPITLTLEEADDPYDLTGCTVTMYMMDYAYWWGEDFNGPDSRHRQSLSTQRGATLKVSGASCDLDADPTTGRFSWTPTATDTDTPGKYILQPHFVFADASVDDAEPIILYVTPSLKALAS